MRKKLIYILGIFFVLQGCETVIEIDVPENTDKLVVEGFVQPNLPPYLFLTTNSGFFEEFSNAQDGFYVHDALVLVEHSGTIDTLEEYCLNDLPPFFRDIVKQTFGFEDVPPGVDICVYANLNFTGQIGTTYNLTVESGEFIITGSTKILSPPKFDSLIALPDTSTLGTPNTILARLDEPANETNFYRLFIEASSDKGFARDGDVFDDQLINGNLTDFFVAQYPSGDTVDVTISHIEEGHFNFWNTALSQEFSGANPFGSPLFIQDNVVGGLGVWGSYSPSSRQIIIP